MPRRIGQAPWRQLIEQIPGIQLVDINLGCSGMAGAYGFSAANFRTSLRIGAAVDRTDATARSHHRHDRMQQLPTADATRHSNPTLHPIKLLALAYGLMPEIRQRLNPNRRRLVVS